MYKLRPFLLLLSLMAGTVSCGPSAPKAPQTVSLLDENTPQHWTAAEMTGEGRVEIESGLLTLHPGEPMTGARFTGDWESLGLPLVNYALTFEARRIEGGDFFATTTFPVGALDRGVSLVVGGWGGGLVGISSIDYQDASENSTRGEIVFEKDRWYQVRIEVREHDLRAWIDGRPMVNVSIKGRHLALKSGEIDHCVPLGFASWRTTGQIRAVRMEKVRPGG